MPQLDFSVFPSQLFWLCISFFTMLFIMNRFILPRTAEMINLRRQKIDDDLEKTAKIKARAEKSLEKYYDALAKASSEANLSLQKTHQEIENTIERRQAELAEALNQQIAEGEKKIQAGKNKAMQQVEGIAAELAVEVIKKLNLKEIKPADIKAALQTTTDER